MGQVRTLILLGKHEPHNIEHNRTAKVWKQFQLRYDLKGHQQAVWAVIAIDDEQFLTGA
jgi:hypothetical protein